MGEDLTFLLSSTQSITDPGRFTQLLGTSMDEIETRASNAPSGATKFVTTEAKFSDLQTLYSLVQCDPLLSSSDCNRCLRTLIGYLPSCCAGKQGGNVLNPSCFIRYEIYPFYKLQAVPSPSPTPVLLAPPPAKSMYRYIYIYINLLSHSPCSLSLSLIPLFLFLLNLLPLFLVPFSSI